MEEVNKIYHKFTQTCQLWVKGALTEFFHLMPKLKALDAFNKIQDNSRKSYPTETKKLLDNLRRYPYHSIEAICLTSQSAD